MQAIANHPVLQVLDLTGNSVGCGTCTVLSDSLRQCTTLARLNLNDNSLTQQGVHMLLKSILLHAPRDLVIELEGASFVKASARALPTSVNELDPDGCYECLLSNPNDRRVATDLMAYAAPAGIYMHAVHTCCILITLRVMPAVCRRLSGSA